jgi:hypothetical protein
VLREVAEYEAYFKDFIAEVKEDGLLNVTKWTEMVQEFPTVVASKEMAAPGEAAKLWHDNFMPMDAVYSTKRFDIVGWWMDDNHGGRFKYLQGLAVVHLSQPYTNAMVERVFSRATWIDGARSQQTLDSTFEMRALDAENRKLVELAKPVLDLNDIQNKVDARRTETTRVKIDDALARFAESLEDEAMQDKDDDNSEKNEEVQEVVQLAGNKGSGSEDSDDDSEDDEDDEDDEGDEPSIFNALKDDEFHAEVNEVLRHMAASKKKPPPSSIKPKSSVPPAASKKKSSRKLI